MSSQVIKGTYQPVQGYSQPTPIFRLTPKNGIPVELESVQVTIGKVDYPPSSGYTVNLYPLTVSVNESDSRDVFNKSWDIGNLLVEIEAHRYYPGIKPCGTHQTYLCVNSTLLFSWMTPVIITKPTNIGFHASIGFEYTVEAFMKEYKPVASVCGVIGGTPPDMKANPVPECTCVSLLFGHGFGCPMYRR